MDFGLSTEQVAWRDEIERFAADLEATQDVVELDRTGEFSQQAWKACAEIGLAGIVVPEAHGGQGGDALDAALAMEALGYGYSDNGLIFSLNAHLWSCVLPIVKFGTDEQKQRWLPGLCDGTVIGVQAMTEPDTGSDAYAMATRVTFEGDEAILTGTKTWITNAPIAGLFVVFAVSDPDAGNAGVTAWLVERDTPGVEVGRPFEKMGLRTSQNATVHLDNVRVPLSNRLGGEGAGFAVFATSMDWERSLILASALGTMRRQLERSVTFARDRTQFGRSIGEFQAVSHRLVDMKARLECARLLLYQLAWRKAQGRRTGTDAALVKLIVSDAYLHNSLDALQTHGGLGYLVEYGLERDVRDAVASRIYSGTSDIQRNLVARGMGLG